MTFVNEGVIIDPCAKIWEAALVGGISRVWRCGALLYLFFWEFGRCYSDWVMDVRWIPAFTGMTLMIDYESPQILSFPRTRESIMSIGEKVVVITRREPFDYTR